MQYALAKENHITVVLGCRKDQRTPSMPAAYDKSFPVCGTKDNKWMEKEKLE